MIKRVICVDDDAICLMIEEMVIRQTNMSKEIHLVNNAPDALSLLNTLHLLDSNMTIHESTTILFLDLNMPGMDGFAFLDALSAKKEELSEKLKIVILSSSIDSKDIIRSKEYEMVINFISKPLTAAVVENLQTELTSPSTLTYES